MLRTLLGARAHGWPDGYPRPQTPAHKVDRWMSDEMIVGNDLNAADRAAMYKSLRRLPHLDLDVLKGSRQAYPIVSELIQAKHWDSLAPMVQPQCLESIVEHYDGTVRALPNDADDSRSILSAVVTGVHAVEPCPVQGVVPGTCRLDVRFCAWQGVTLHDLQSSEPLLRSEPRLQVSTWCFEGVATASCEADDASAAAAGTWRVARIGVGVDVRLCSCVDLLRQKMR